ncbi:MAG: hypothetical protein CME06_09075 [Gemmatimonadetes bacterium]|nr:hypothetical protein [Gemmatimonadota bacterium]
MTTRKVLGRGLSALIPPEGPENDTDALVHLPVGRIVPNPFQPRVEFEQEAIDELAASIREKGVIQPILVRPAGDVHQLVAGERRLRAARQAGLTQVPCVVKELSDLESLELALIENIQRRDLTAIERARAYRQLMERFDYTQSDLARHLGKNRASVANTLRLLALPDRVQEMVHGGQLSPGHAKAILALPAGTDVEGVATRAASMDWSVRELERMGRKPRKKKSNVDARDANVQVIENRLQQVLGTRVRFHYRKGRGRIEVEFFSEDDLHRVLELLGVTSECS